MLPIRDVFLLPNARGGRNIVGVDIAGKHLQLVKGRFQTFKWVLLQEGVDLSQSEKGTLEKFGYKVVGSAIYEKSVADTLNMYSSNTAQKEADADKHFIADYTEIAVGEPDLSEEQKRAVQEMEEAHANWPRFYDRDDGLGRNLFKNIEKIEKYIRSEQI